MQRTTLAALVAGVIGISAVPAQELSRAEADSMNGKIVRIQETAASPRAQSARPVRTSFTDREANAYFGYYGPMFLPAGVAMPQVAIGDGGNVTARAIVDLDAVRLSQTRSFLDPLAFVTGSLEVVASGVVAGADGWGIARFTSATVAGVSVPKSVAQELLRFYTRTPERPNGFEFDKPFELPAGIRSVVAERGRAVIVQ